MPSKNGEGEQAGFAFCDFSFGQASQGSSGCPYGRKRKMGEALRLPPPLPGQRHRIVLLLTCGWKTLHFIQGDKNLDHDECSDCQWAVIYQSFRGAPATRACASTRGTTCHSVCQARRARASNLVLPFVTFLLGRPHKAVRAAPTAEKEKWARRCAGLSPYQGKDIELSCC